MPSRPRTRSVVAETLVEREARRAEQRVASELRTRSHLSQHPAEKPAKIDPNAARNAGEDKALTKGQGASRAEEPQEAGKKKVQAGTGKAEGKRKKKARPPAESGTARTKKRSAATKHADLERLLGPRPDVLSTLLESIEEGVAHVSTDGTILYANARFAELLGAVGSDIVTGQTNLRDFLAAECWAELDHGLQLALKEPAEGSLRLEDPQHQTVHSVRMGLSPVHWQKATTIKVTATEMTELMQKNRELLEKESSLHALSARILQLQEEERRRIARDLHDITGQELAVVIMQLMQVAKQQRMDAAAEKGIADAASLVKKIEDEIRTLSYVLHPPLLDELGLSAALNWYAEGFTKRSGIEVKVEVPQNLPRLPHEKEMAIFRVVQEALTNVLRHSGSHKAQIRLTFDQEAVELTVQDEGKGMPRRRFGKAEKEHGVGIAGMRERLQQLGGGLEVRPLRKGTQVAARVPIKHAEPIETPLTEADILKVAKALGYQGEAATAAAHAGGAQAVSTGHAPGNAAARGASVATKRILIVDDHEVTRQGVHSLLKDERDLEICGEAQDAMQAVAKARELNPDLIIMDLTMPGGGGFAAAREIRQAGMPAKIIFFTTHTSRELERLSRLSGFEGFVQKTDGARDLVRGVRAVLQGNKFFSTEVVKGTKASSSSA